MYINTFKYKPEDVSCVLCTEYVKKLGCTALSCPCLAERMEAGTVGYAGGRRRAVSVPSAPDRKNHAAGGELSRHHVAGRRPQEAHGDPAAAAGLPQRARHAGVFRRAVSADLQQRACGQDLQLLLPRRHRLPLRPQARHLIP